MTTSAEPRTTPASVDTTRRQTASTSPSGAVAATNTSEEQHPKLPHERDQSVDMTHGQPDAQVQQAYRDVQRGLQDTDRGPPAGRAYQKQK